MSRSCIVQILSALISTFFSFCVINPCLAEPNVPRELLDSVVLLSAPGSGCATGFIDEKGRIFTNVHVSRAVCRFGTCRAARLQRAGGLDKFAGADIPTDGLRVVKELPSLDVAILELDNAAALEGAFGPVAPPRVGDKVRVLGFPHCRALKLGEGEIVSRDDLRVYFSAQIAHGSSGSPVFDENNRLVGIVDEASTLLGGLDSMFLGGTFDGRGVNARTVMDLFERDERASLLREAQLLNDFYLKQVQPLRFEDRLRESFEFTDRVSSFLERLALSRDEEALRSALSMERDISLLPRMHPPGGQLSQEVEKLGLAHNLDSNGLIGSDLHKIDTDGLIEAIKTSGREPLHAEALIQIVRDFKTSGYRGSIWSVSLVTGVIVIALVFAGMIWAWTLGFTFVRASGGVIRRFFVMLLVAIAIWPLSFLVFLVLSRRRSPAQ